MGGAVGWKGQEERGTRGAVRGEEGKKGVDPGEAVKQSFHQFLPGFQSATQAGLLVGTKKFFKC